MKFPALLLSVFMVVGASGSSFGQDQSSNPETFQNNSSGSVTSGTVFLARLDGSLSTKEDKTGKEFRLITLDPIHSAEGRVIPVGSEIRGHIDKVTSAHQIGRGRLWLTLDQIKTPVGWLPIVAEVTDVPGVHSVRVNTAREGAIETNSGKRNDDVAAALAAAMAGAAPGVAAHDAKGAATGAATSAATAFLIESGLGQDVLLEKQTKLEITLDRPIYFSND